MASSRTRFVRYTCNVCGNRSRGQSFEVLVRTYYLRQRVWEWTHRELCPPCELAARDSLNLGVKVGGRSTRPSSSGPGRG